MLLLAALLLIPSMNLAREDGPSRSDETWTILVYMVGDCDLESDAIDDFNELEMIGSTDKVNILVQLDRIAGFDNRSGDWTDTRRFRVLKDDDPNEIRSTQLEILGEVNMADPEVLTDFIEWGVTSYPAEHYMLSIWGHARGVTEGLCIDYSSPSNSQTMGLREFGSAFRNVSAEHNVKFDVVSLDVCWMGMAETAFELMGHASYMIAAFDETPAAGWPYDVCIPLLLDDSKPIRSRLADVVDGFMSVYDIDGRQSYATLSAIDLDAFQASFVPAFERLSEEMFYSAHEQKALYESVIRDVDRTRRKDEMVDVYQAAELLSKVTGIPEKVRAFSLDILATEGAVIVHHRSGSYHQEGARAFGIYHPLGYYDSRYARILAADMTAWDDYVNLHISGVQATPVRINWTDLAPDKMTFTLRTTTPGGVASVSIEVGEPGSMTTYPLGSSGGLFSHSIDRGGRSSVFYRYILRTTKGVDITYPPDGYEEVRFASESDPPEVLHWPPSILDPSAGDRIVFYIRDRSGVDLENTALFFREKGATDMYSVPLEVISYDAFRSELTCAASVDWIAAGSQVEYYLEAFDIYGNSVRHPGSGFLDTLLGEGNRFYFDGRHSSGGGYAELMSMMNGSMILSETGSGALDASLLSQYKGYVLLEPIYPFTQSEIDSLREYHQKGGEVLLILDPTSSSQRTVAAPILSFLDVDADGGAYPGGVLISNPFTQFGDALPPISVDSGPTLSHTGNSQPLYMAPEAGTLMVLSWKLKGKAIVSTPSILGDGPMDRSSNRALARRVLDFLSTNLPPEVSILQDPPGVVRPGTRITFDLSGSMDRDGSIVIYSMQVPGFGYSESPDPLFDFTFQTSGLYTVMFSAIDEGGARTFVTWSVRVNRPPTPEVGVSSLEVFAGVNVLFDYKGNDPEGDEYTLVWDFGDGSKAGGRTVSHAYRRRGIYNVSLTVKDVHGMSSTWTGVVNVKNSYPAVSIPRGLIMVNDGEPSWTGSNMVTLQAREGDVIFITSEGTVDMDRGDVLNFTWDMGDGSRMYGGDIEYVYRTMGLFTVELTVTDGHGGVGVERISVFIQNNDPRPSFTVKAGRGGRVELDASLTHDDPWDIEGLQYVWDLGNGRTETTTDPVLSYRYAFGGRYLVNLTVIDPDGGRGYEEAYVTAGGMTLGQTIGSFVVFLLILAGIAAAAFFVVRRRMIEKDVGLVDIHRPRGDGIVYQRFGERKR